MIEELKTENLEIGRKYLVGELEFRGIWTYVEENNLYHAFAFAETLNKIRELHIPKKLTSIFKENEKMPIVLSREYYLISCDPHDDRERFLDLARKMMIKND